MNGVLFQMGCRGDCDLLQVWYCNMSDVHMQTSNWKPYTVENQAVIDFNTPFNSCNRYKPNNPKNSDNAWNKTDRVRLSTVSLASSNYNLIVK